MIAVAEKYYQRGDSRRGVESMIPSVADLRVQDDAMITNTTARKIYWDPDKGYSSNSNAEADLPTPKSTRTDGQNRNAADNLSKLGGESVSDNKRKKAAVNIKREASKPTVRDSSSPKKAHIYGTLAGEYYTSRDKDVKPSGTKSRATEKDSGRNDKAARVPVEDSEDTSTVATEGVVRAEISQEIRSSKSQSLGDGTKAVATRRALQRSVLQFINTNEVFGELEQGWKSQKDQNDKCRNIKMTRGNKRHEARFGE